jgi:hypothetical protein
MRQQIRSQRFCRRTCRKQGQRSSAPFSAINPRFVQTWSSLREDSIQSFHAVILVGPMVFLQQGPVKSLLFRSWTLDTLI